MDHGTIAVRLELDYASSLWDMIADSSIVPSTALKFELYERRTRIPLSHSAYKLKDLRELDPQVLSELHKTFFAKLYRYTRSRVPNDNLAEDIASETFLRLLDAVHTNKGPNSSVGAWLFGTASNLINDHFRRKYREDEMLVERRADQDSAKTADTFKQIEQRDLLRTALNRLTDEQKHVIALRFGSGMSVQETAQIMNKNVNAVKGLQFRALRSLRKELEVEG